jgi:hypothetical protein
MRFFAPTILAGLMAFSFAAEAPSLSLPQEQAETWSRTTAATMALRYDEAFTLAKKLRNENEGAGCVL